jgi:hypothetical protein
MFFGPQCGTVVLLSPRILRRPLDFCEICIMKITTKTKAISRTVTYVALMWPCFYALCNTKIKVISAHCYSYLPHKVQSCHSIREQYYCGLRIECESRRCTALCLSVYGLINCVRLLVFQFAIQKFKDQDT